MKRGNWVRKSLAIDLFFFRTTEPKIIITRFYRYVHSLTHLITDTTWFISFSPPLVMWCNQLHLSDTKTGLDDDTNYQTFPSSHYLSPKGDNQFSEVKSLDRYHGKTHINCYERWGDTKACFVHSWTVQGSYPFSSFSLFSTDATFDVVSSSLSPKTVIWFLVMCTPDVWWLCVLLEKCFWEATPPF